MNPAAEIPAAVAVLAALLVLAGAVLTLIGTLGLLRLRSFYARVHAPTMGTTLGAGCMLIASILLFSALESRPVLHEIAIGVFMTLTTPVTLMLLLRAAMQRGGIGSRAGESGEAPPQGPGATQAQRLRGFRPCPKGAPERVGPRRKAQP